ncbi:MAG TPA: hypothetical protein VMS55_22190 [Myxococcota bacterium]|nr:hypothetical protein [Myxococcota bacterium]
MGARVALTLLSLLGMPALAQAHPGHGIDPSGASLAHYFGEPEHALPLLGVVTLAAVLWGLAALARRPS